MTSEPPRTTGETPRPIVCKLGGSVVTDKERPETLDEAALGRAADAIATALDGSGTTAPDGSSADGRGGGVDGLVLVHGGGSFGHHNASGHGVTTTSGTHDPEAVEAIHGAMRTLNDAVRSRLLDRGVPAVPVHPFSTASRDETGALDLSIRSVETMLGEGFVPVLHGDLVAHARRGATVVSGDELVVALADALGADRVGLCSTVPGVLDADGRVIERIDSFDAVAAVLGGSDATDVTGGMAAKVETLLDLDAEASIFGLEALADFLAGKAVGTTID